MTPTATPKIRATIRARKILLVDFKTRATNMALIAVLEPTVRSIWPALNTNTPATDIIEIIAVCLKMFKRFCVLAKPFSLNVIAKNTNTTARTIYTIYLLICIFLLFPLDCMLQFLLFHKFFAAYSSCDLSIKNCYDVITDCHHFC